MNIRYCQKCGTANTLTETRCSVCQSSLLDNESSGNIRPQQVVQPPVNRNRRRILIAGLTTGALGLAAWGSALAILNARNGASPSKQLAASTDATAQPSPTSTASQPSPTSTTEPTPGIQLPGTLYTYHGHSAAVYNVAWSPDGKWLASCDSQNLLVWEALTGRNILSRQVPISEEAITGLAWANKGQAVAIATGMGNVYVIGVPAGNTLITHIHVNPAGFSGLADNFTLAWSPDGQELVSGGLDKDNAILVWSAFQATLLRQYTEQAHHTGFASFGSPTSSRLSTTGRTNVTSARSGQGFVNPVVAWSPNGKYIASGGNDAIVEIWSPATGATISSYTGHQELSLVQPDIHSNVLSSLFPQQTRSGGAPGEITALAWSPQSTQIASASTDKTVKISSISADSTILNYTQHAAPVNSVSWSPDGQYLVSADTSGLVQIWSASSGATIFPYTNHAGSAHMAMYSPDGKMIASCADDGTVQVWSSRPK